jgi:hypothetical protein
LPPDTPSVLARLTQARNEVAAREKSA